MRPRGSPRRGAVCFVPAPRRWRASPSSRRLAADPAARPTRPMAILGQAPRTMKDVARRREGPAVALRVLLALGAILAGPCEAQAEVVRLKNGGTIACDTIEERGTELVL